MTSETIYVTYNRLLLEWTSGADEKGTVTKWFTVKSPLDMYSRKGWINRRQYFAGIEFRDDFEIVRRHGFARAPDLELCQPPRKNAVPITVPERVLLAQDRLNRAEERMGHALKDIAVFVCCLGGTVAQWGKHRGYGHSWAAEKGKRLLQEALDALQGPQYVVDSHRSFVRYFRQS